MSLLRINENIIDTTGNYVFNGLDLTANLTSGNANLGNLATANYVAGTLTTAAQPNVTSVGTLSSVSVSGLTTATGGVKTANILDTSGTITLQTKYNSVSGDVGVLGNIIAGTGGTGNVTATYFIGNGSTLTSIAGGNVTGQVGNALVAGTVYTADQPNITSVGNMTGLTVNGIISLYNATEVRTAPTISAGTLTIDLNTASIFDVALNSNITTLTLSNVQATGYSSSFVLIFTADGTSRTVVWPASFKWPSGTAPTITSTNGKKDVFVFFTVDGGTSWQAFISGQNL